MARVLICDNCGRRFEDDTKLRHIFPDIPDLLTRLDPGGTVPAGECPDCGALVYPEADPVRVLILLDGGLVQHVLADKPGADVVVLNMDLDGIEEEDGYEIVAVTGEFGTLRGTMEGHEPTVAPAQIESAWRPAA